MKKIIQYIYRSAFFPLMPFEVMERWENEGYGINQFLLIVLWTPTIIFIIMGVTGIILNN